MTTMDTTPENEHDMADMGEEAMHPQTILSPVPSIISTIGRPTPLSDRQQQRLRQYFDDALTNISRQFIRGHSTEDEGYRSLTPLLQDVDRLVDLIWYSVVSSTPATQVGQPYYLLRVADEVVDYLQGMKINPDSDEPKKVIRLLQKLDTQLAKLVHGVQQDEGACKLGQTEIVRLESIAERTRVAALEAFGAIPGWETQVGNVYTQVFDNYDTALGS